MAFLTPKDPGAILPSEDCCGCCCCCSWGDCCWDWLTPKSFILSIFGVVPIRWGLCITFLKEEEADDPAVFRPVSTLAVTRGGFFVLMCAIVLALVVVLLAILLAVLRFDALRMGRSARPLSVTTGSKSGISCSVNTFGGGSTSSVVAIEPISLDGMASTVGLPAMAIVGAESTGLEPSAVVVMGTDGVEISVPTSVTEDEDDEMVLLLDTVCSPKPESDVEALFSSFDSESRRGDGNQYFTVGTIGSGFCRVGVGVKFYYKCIGDSGVPINIDSEVIDAW